MIVLPPVFCNSMILQAEKPVKLFGCGDGIIRIRAGSDTVIVQSQDGKFCAILPPCEYGACMDISISDSNGEAVLENVVFGDVYLFAGQSNIEFKLSAARPDGDVYESNQIRVFSFGTINQEERFLPEAGWIPLTKDTAPDISALAYFTARELHRRKQQPIGIITAYQGASVIESWLSPNAIAELNIPIQDSDRFSDYTDEAYSQWNRDSILYNRNILPLLPYTLSGIVWYQGESNCGDGEARFYDTSLTKLITSWRAAFQDDKIPFAIVQIADYAERDFAAWHEIQNRQEMVCNTLPHCSLVVSKDVSENDDIHPPTKHLLANRIAVALQQFNPDR